MQEHAADGFAQLLAAAAPCATPRALGLLLLREDPQFARIEADQADALIDAALQDGRWMADSISGRWGNDPDLIAHRCGVSVSECDAEHGWGTSVVYAEYLDRPPRIRLFRLAIERIDRGLARAHALRILGIHRARPVLLAHELYHHFDAIRGDPPLARRHRVTLLRLGSWRWTSGLVSLAEIAAGAFAQRLLGLCWHPKLLDLVTVFDANPTAATRLVAVLRAGNLAPILAGTAGRAA
jgi:hypothetical protein